MVEQTGGKSYSLVMTAEVIPASLWGLMKVEYVKNGIPMGWHLPAIEVLKHTSPLGFRAVARQYFDETTLEIGFHLREAVGGSTIHCRLAEHPCDQCMTFRDIQRQDDFTKAQETNRGAWATANGARRMMWHWLDHGSDVSLCEFEPSRWESRSQSDPQGGERCKTCLTRLKRRNERGY